jgi:PAS domain S-box-containing protein
MGLSNMAVPTASVFVVLGTAMVLSGLQENIRLWSLGVRTAAALGAGLMLLLGIGLYTSRSVIHLADTVNQVAQAENVLHYTAEVVDEAAKAQTFARDYAVAGGERDAKSQRQAAARCRNVLAELRQLIIASDPSQNTRAARLEAQVNEALQCFSTVIGSRHAGVPDGLPPGMANNGEDSMDNLHRVRRILGLQAINQGEDLMDDLRATAGEMQDSENGLLQAHQVESDRVSLFVQTVIVTGTAVGLVLLLSTVLKLNRATTERNRSDEALRQEQAMILALMDNLPDHIYFKDTASRFIRVNPAHMRALGADSPAQVTGKTDADFFPVEHSFKALADEQDILRTGQALVDVEEKIIGPAGDERWVLTTKLPLRDAAGRITGTCGISSDITARKRMVAALRESEALLKESQIIAGLGSYAFDFLADRWNSSDVLDGIFGVDKAYERSLAGWSALIHPADRAMMVDYFKDEVAGRGRPFDKEYRIVRHNDRAERWVHGLGRLEFDAQGRPVKMIGTIQDITGRKRAEEEIRTILRTMMDSFYLVDTEGRFLDVNDSYCQMIGYGREELLKMAIKDVEARETEEVIKKRIEQIKEAGHARFETEHRRKDGSIIAIEASCNFVGNEKERLFVFMRDITERKRMEETLRESEERFRTLFNNASDGILLLSDEGRILSVNKSFARMHGYSREEMLRMSMKDLDTPETFQKIPARLRRALAGEDFSFEVEHYHKDGHVLQLEVTAGLVSLGGKNVVQAFHRDITERKRAAEAHARLATAVEQAAETIVITDTTGAILYVNPAFEKNSGYTRAEAIGKNPRILKSGRQDAEFYRQMWAMLTRGEVWHGHFMNKRKDGSFYEEEATISPIRDTAGAIINYVAVKRDVTREAQLEAQFRQAQKMDAIGTLAGGVAHDFNNILAVIQLQIGMLIADKKLSSQQLDFAREIEKAGQRAADLTRQLLLFGRKQVLQLRDLDLNAVISDVTKMLRRIMGEDIMVQFNFSPHPLLIHADTGMINQVLMNLAVNARDAMPKGGQIIIETSAAEFDENKAARIPQARPGSFACVSVTDIGSGIPPEILSRIFEPFFTTKEAGKGTGLGLATVFGIVQQHQGWISVRSKVGRGTTFKIYLPRLAGSSDQNSFWSAQTPAVNGSETILLVEDEAPVRKSMRDTLGRLGYHVLEAATGAEALAVWEQHRDEIRLLLTDLVMPGGMNGKDLAAQLLQRNSKLKVIYASGYSADVAGKDFPLEEGVNFLAKPFELYKLAQTVRNRLDKT